MSNSNRYSHHPRYDQEGNYHGPRRVIHMRIGRIQLDRGRRRHGDNGTSTLLFLKLSNGRNAAPGVDNESLDLPVIVAIRLTRHLVLRIVPVSTYDAVRHTS